MSNGVINQDIYNRYFGIKPDESTASDVTHPENNVYDNEKSARVHLKESILQPGAGMVSYRLVADENIDDLEQLASILKKLCNAAWGSKWGELSPDLKYGENSSEIVLPQITVEINTRDTAEGLGKPKPALFDIVKETDENGIETGDAFLLYRQWFECNVEFNIYGRTNKEARQIQKKFETLLTVYTGYLKRNGISEMVFQREVSPKCSLNYDESTPMRSIYYYIRFESITPIRQSLINSINLEIGANQLNADKVRTFIDNSSKSEMIELDFFDGDNGITYRLDN